MRIIYLLVAIICLASCKNNVEYSDQDLEKCPYGLPQAIFSKDLPNVSSYEFTTQKDQTTERITFDSLALELVQYGCKTLHQEFRFQLPYSLDSEDPLYWLEEGAHWFEYLSKLDFQYLPLKTEFAAILDNAPSTFNMGEDSEFALGRFLRLDKIKNESGNMLIVKFSMQMQ